MLHRDFQTLGRGFEALSKNEKLIREFKKLVQCLCYNMAHAVSISHGNILIYVKTETSTKYVPIFAQTFVATDLKLSIRETVI